MSHQGPLWGNKIRDEIRKAVVGQETVVERLLVALLANGHVLLEGMPGLAKTLLIKSLGSALGVKFERIQFTPDLLPSDVVGTMIFLPKDGTFQVHRGPIFGNLVLADEINRSPAKVQSALLEAMQERQVTIGGESYQLPRPFFVMATQNPVDQEGTYPLPEAQVDRFLFKLLVPYPTETEEREMMQRWGKVTEQPQVQVVSSGEECIRYRHEVDQVFVSPTIETYLLSLVRATRELASKEIDGIRQLEFGASPRATLALTLSSKALAWLRGMDHVTPALIQELAPDILRHRIGITYEAEAAGLTPDRIIELLIHKTPLENVLTKN